MQDQAVDVVGVGNAIVDVIAQASDEFLESQDLAKGAMALIDEARAHELYDLMGPAIEASGGSAANTMAGIASFGGTASYIGKVRKDQLGAVFAHDLRASGVAFDMPPTETGPATGRSLILVTPDAQRTMNTYLGISSLLEPADIPAPTVEGAGLLFCEGYLWDVDSAKRAIRLAMELARGAGSRVALTLSDAFCVERHHQDFVELVSGPVDVLFANENELRALYGCDFDTAIERVRGHVGLGCLTRGENGSVLVTDDDTVEIKAENVGPVVDTTGAGDQYAAGVLYGLARGFPLAEAGRLGSLAAAEVISHVGPRPQRPLNSFL
ncbi:MAG: adenosine kinase [Acidimicrobiia bacterium]|nr:adenosine kinase [Acidimicrobiia bacterium]